MRGDNGKGCRAAWARGVAALCAVLAMGLGLLAQPAEAAPFAYVANGLDNTVSVIDTAPTSPSVVATVAVGSFPGWVAVTPDGTHVYVATENDGAVSVIDTSTNKVTATVRVGSTPEGVAITPGGQTRLCHELVVRQCFGDRDDRKHSDDHGHGAVWPL